MGAFYRADQTRHPLDADGDNHQLKGDGEAVERGTRLLHFPEAGVEAVVAGKGISHAFHDVFLKNAHVEPIIGLLQTAQREDCKGKMKDQEKG